MKGAGVRGLNTMRFTGWIGRRRLAPGAYRATLVAEAGGRSAAPQRLTFRVIGPKRTR
jgi:hypothetical protein